MGAKLDGWIPSGSSRAAGSGYLYLGDWVTTLGQVGGAGQPLPVGSQMPLWHGAGHPGPVGAGTRGPVRRVWDTQGLFIGPTTYL